ncbi:MAG: ParB/RepB/Spo0J family partition protein [Bacilli bacterium]
MSKGLGKGINALFPELEVDKQEKVIEIPISELRPNPYQPRKIFTAEAIDELATSILEHGVIQPIIVRKSIKGFDIVVGERRFRASQKAGLAHIPAVVRNLSEPQMMEIALLENLQRENLNCIEEAQAYQQLLQKLKITQEELAKRVGKSRPHIANTVRLLILPDEIQSYIAKDELSMGHARALIGLKDKQKIVAMAKIVIEEQLNVRQLERLIQEQNTENVSRETKPKPEKNVFVQQQEEKLTEHFGTSVKIKSGKQNGKIEINFLDESDCNRILELIFNR